MGLRGVSPWQTPEGARAVQRAAWRRWAQRAPRERLRAHWRFQKAVADGRLTREPCEQCGARAEGHHWHGYEGAAAFDVQWLCRTHHVAAHGGTFGGGR